MKKLNYLLMSLLFTAAIVSCTKEEGGNAPLLGPGLNGATVAYANNGGNITCEEVTMAIRDECDDPDFVFTHTSGKIDYSGGTGGTTGPITWHTDGVYVWWESTKPINVAVIVKGGNNASVYYSGCGECVMSSGMVKLSAPINPKNNKPYGLSNITFCYNECEQPDLVVALKSYVTVGEWVVTGPSSSNFIDFEDFVSGASYPLYLNGQSSSPVGTLVVGQFDADPYLEVRITSNVASMYFTTAYLFVGTEAEFNTAFASYDYIITSPANTSVVTFYDVTY